MAETVRLEAPKIRGRPFRPRLYSSIKPLRAAAMTA
jgi:hypothetical protein